MCIETRYYFVMFCIFLYGGKPWKASRNWLTKYFRGLQFQTIALKSFVKMVNKQLKSSVAQNNLKDKKMVDVSYLFQQTHTKFYWFL